MEDITTADKISKLQEEISDLTEAMLQGSFGSPHSDVVIERYEKHIQEKVDLLTTLTK
tara:strand:+ start:10 stop:183 length:174 start_codon:yes stop_codon:yes gene_type:complete